MTAPTLSKVREWLRDLASEHPDCERCERREFLTPGELANSEWRMDPCRMEFVRRCAKCAGTLLYPWASTLDAHRVQAWLRANLRDGGRIDLDKLRRECADRGGFSFPYDPSSDL